MEKEKHSLTDIFDNISYSIEKSIDSLKEYYEESKKINRWNDKILYYKIGTVIMWIGIWIDKRGELDKNAKTNDLEKRILDAFNGIYNAQKHSIKVYQNTIQSTSLFPNNNLYPGNSVFPSSFSCKWTKINTEGLKKNTKKCIDIYNDFLVDKDVIPTLVKVKDLIINKTDEIIKINKE